MSAAGQSARYWNTRRRLAQVALQTILVPLVPGMTVDASALYSVANQTQAFEAQSSGTAGTFTVTDSASFTDSNSITYVRAPLSALVRLVNGGVEI